MTVVELINVLQANGIRLKAQREQLAVDAPRGMITEAIRQAIRQHKPALLALLQHQPPRNAGGFPLTDHEHPCMVCGSPEWQ
jgi:TubC N-terminal docking domain